MVLSSEEFSRARPQSVDFAELAGFVAGFDRRRVVCYLRNQADYIQSVYLQVLKRGRIIGFDRFVAACIAERFAGGMFLDYGALYAQVRAGFAAEEIASSPMRRLPATRGGSPATSSRRSAAPPRSRRFGAATSRQARWHSG